MIRVETIHCSETSKCFHLARLHNEYSTSALGSDDVFSAFLMAGGVMPMAGLTHEQYAAEQQSEEREFLVGLE